MTIELKMLMWTVVLGLVYIILPSAYKARLYGMKWAIGPRDEPHEPDKISGRLDRAQKNFFETMPLFAAAVLVAHASGGESNLSASGALLYFWCRVAYLPIYIMGIPLIRTLVWGGSMAGLIMVVLASVG